MKKIFHKTEFYIGIVLILFCAVVQLRSGQFLTGNNIVDLIRSFTVPVMFCMLEMMVLISGGVDVSFPAIASMSMFISCYTLPDSANPMVFFIVAMIIGLAIGALNGLIIGYFKLPDMIVTLAMSSICFGIMLGVFRAREYPLPTSLLKVGQAKLFTAQNTALGISSDLPAITLIMVALIAITWFILNKTMLGRGIYAIGGGEIAAQRAGFNVFGTKMFIYCFSGCISGMVGIIRATMLQMVHPFNLGGIEMIVIAGCVLGGVKITGGKGTVLGAVLGIALLTTISNSLILIGIDTEWQNVFTGLIIIIGTTISALQIKFDANKITVKPESGKRSER